MNINPIHTPCKQCVFAQYVGNTQNGCSLNYLDIYRQQGLSILEAYDDELEFYIINDKKSIGYRENSWFVQGGVANGSLEDKLAYYKSINKLHYLLVLNLKELGSDPAKMDELQSSLKELEIHPKKIVFIRDSNLNDYTSYSYINKMMIKAKIDCPWRIQSMVDESLSAENILHSVICLNKPYRFICSVKKLPADINTLINKANSLVHEQLEKFSVLSNQDHSAIVFPGSVYRFAIAEKHKDILMDQDSYQII